MNPPSISFIIPHKGREAFLQQTLGSIAALDGSGIIDVILVTQNAGLSAETLSAKDHLSLKVIHARADMTISALRNRGVQESSADYLAFLDADIVLSPNWLNALLPLLHDDVNVALVSAMQRSSADASTLEVIRTTLSNAVVDAAVDFLPGRNLLVARTNFDAVGGFPEHLITCEDYYFTDKVSEIGTLWYSSAASYIHLGEDHLYAEMFKKEIWRGQSNLQSLHGRHVKSSEWPSFLVPPWVTLMALLTPLALLMDSRQAAALVCTAALLPFAAYVTRLYLLGDKKISLAAIIKFYSYYFPARAWGTLVGAFRNVGRDLHDH